MNPDNEQTKKFFDLSAKDKAMLISMHMFELDRLSEIEDAKAMVYVEQIEDIAKDAGLHVPEDVKDDLLYHHSKQLKEFVKHLYSKQWDQDMLRLEIEGFRKKRL